MRRVVAQARKELTQIRRDRLALALALVLPVALIALLGTSISLTVTDIPIVIQDLTRRRRRASTPTRSAASLTFRVSAPAACDGAGDDADLGRAAARRSSSPSTSSGEIRRGRPAR